MRGPVVQASALGLVLGVALACAWLAEAPPPPAAPVWQPCGDFACAEVRVPLDHGARGGATLALRIARLSAAKPEQNAS